MPVIASIGHRTWIYHPINVLFFYEQSPPHENLGLSNAIELVVDFKG